MIKNSQQLVISTQSSYQQRAYSRTLMQKSYDIFADDGTKALDESTTKFSEHLMEARLDSERV